ncbi:hypothetical protein PMAYCL1PPCAC_20358, partial [Pristionchus mayeri]
LHDHLTVRPQLAATAHRECLPAEAVRDREVETAVISEVLRGQEPAKVLLLLRIVHLLALVVVDGVLVGRVDAREHLDHVRSL